MKPFLPQLTDKLEAGPRPGIWNISPTPVFTKIAQSLKHPDGTISSRVNSIPSPWARALLFQSVFLSSQHPNRVTLIQEYVGLLASLAFSKVRGIPIQAKLVDLKTLKEAHSFAASLHCLLPPEAYSIYLPTQGVHPWERIYSFSINGEPIALTSPATLVVPSISLSPILRDIIPWIEEVEQDKAGSLQISTYRFTDPAFHLSDPEKAMFSVWLSTLKSSLSGSSDLEESIKTILTNYAEKISRGSSSSIGIKHFPQVFGEALGPKPLASLEHIIEPSALGRSSNVKVLAGSKSSDLAIYFVDKLLVPQILNLSEQNIYVENAVTLAAFRHETDAKPNALYLTAAEFFLPRMRWFNGGNRLPGSWVDKIQPCHEEKTIIPPLNPKLRFFFSSQDLKKALKLSEVNTSQGKRIRVTLEFEISGVDKPQKVSVYHDYPFNEEDELKSNLPYLALWPNVPDDSSWSSYYTLVEEHKNRETSAYAFTIESPSSDSVDTVFAQDKDYILRLWQSKAHPDILSIIDSRNENIGLLPISLPDAKVRRAIEWTVGVDFGTSFTNIHVNKAGFGERLDLAMFTLNIIDTERNFDTNTDYFVPEVLAAPKNGHNPPMSTLLTIKGSYDTGETPEFLSGARVYVPAFSGKAMDDHIKSDIKWSNPKYLDAFLSSLIRLVSAHAACYKVQKITWKASYPTAFSCSQVQRYQNAWIRAIDSSKKASELEHSLGTDGDQGDAFKTESIAFSQYFVDRLGEQIGYATCLDIGGGTSDISIWKDLRLLHQLSVPFAGRDIFHNILAQNKQRIGDLFGIKDDSDRQSLLRDLDNSGDNFNAFLDNHLRLKGDLILERIRNGENTKLLKRFRGMLALAYAGIYYYIGLVLSYLGEKEATPVYLGGNGSRFVNWIDPDGTFRDASEINQLLGYILTKAGSFPPGQQQYTVLSQHPKEEVAGGLVIENTKLTGLTLTNPEAFAGIGMEFITDTGSIKFNPGQEISLNSDVTTIKDIRIPDFSEMSKFMAAFNEGIRIHKLQTIESPLQATDSKKILDFIASDLRNQVKHLLNKKLQNAAGSTLAYEPEPGFIVVHKALLHVLAKKWAREA
jgi:hypothetical protein